VEKNMQNQKAIYLDYPLLADRYKDYAYPKSKISQLVRNGKLLRLRRGLYIEAESKDYSLKTLANLICFPSYISFEYALSYYGLIPEQVKWLTSASFQKHKSKIYHTPLGNFIYYDISPSVYAHGICRIAEDEKPPFLIASMEKALLDTLSKIRGVRSMKAMEQLVVDDLRIDVDLIKDMDHALLEFLSSRYHQSNGRLFYQWLKAKRL
jgi:predicted transcriptional regulator of viral defense system